MQWGDAARIWAALTEGSLRRWRFSNRGRCSLWYSPENRRWTGKTWGCLHGAHHSVFPGTGAVPPGLLKQPCLTNQRLQEEIQGLLVSARDCLNAAISCMTTLHHPLPSAYGNIAQIYPVCYTYPGFFF